MPSPRTYATAGAFRRALEERLKRASLTDQIDPNRLRRQVSFDRLLARLFREESAPWVLKGGYALELRFKAARSTVDIDLTVQRVAASASGDQNQIVREMLQSAADISLGDWFEFVVGRASMDLTAAPYGGARYPVEARMDERTFARFHLDAGVGDVVMRPLETIVCRDWLGFAVQWLEQKLQNRFSGRWPLDLCPCGRVPASERAARIASPAEDTPVMHCMVARASAGFPYTCQTTWPEIWSGPSATAAIFRNS